MFFRVIKICVEGCVILLFASCIACNRFTAYLSQAAVGQMRIVTQSKKIDNYLTTPNLPDSVRTKLQLVNEIRAYAFGKLGLNETSNYTKFYDQKGKPLLWVVSASKEFELVPKLWWFPIVGRVSYKGFFTLDGADEQADELLEEGYDTRIREVNAWSTLGFFSDPVMSSMLEYPEADLAELLFHELSHSTIYIKGDVDFSESLANFIGIRGAMLYLEDKYGKNSKEYTTYVNQQTDYDRFDKYMLLAANKLDSVYATFTPQQPVAEKRKIKKAFIKQIVTNVDTVNFADTAYFYYAFKNRPLPNNAYFIVKRQYSSKMAYFENELTTIAQGDLIKYIAYLRDKYKK